MTDHATLAPASPIGTVQRLREDLIHPDPLLDCLIEVCRLHGQAASRASLSAGLPLGADNLGRLTLELAARAAARAGMSARLQRVALQRIDTAALPVDWHGDLVRYVSQGDAALQSGVRGLRFRHRFLFRERGFQ